MPKPRGANGILLGHECPIPKIMEHGEMGEQWLGDNAAGMVDTTTVINQPCPYQTNSWLCSQEGKE